jgi:hypothetical protein
VCSRKSTSSRLESNVTHRVVQGQRGCVRRTGSDGHVESEMQTGDTLSAAFFVNANQQTSRNAVKANGRDRVIERTTSDCQSFDNRLKEFKAQEAEPNHKQLDHEPDESERSRESEAGTG